MPGKPTYKELEQRIHELEQSEFKRKRTETESEEKYRTLIQNIQAGVIVHGPDTKILICNAMGQELLGLTEEQLLGRTASDPLWHFFHENGTVMRTEEYPVNQVIAKRKALTNFIVGVHRPNKEQQKDVWVLINAHPVFINDEIVQVIETFVDVSDRQRAEEALRESENKYQSLFGNAQVALFRTNISDGKLLEINERYAKMAGYSNVGDCMAEFNAADAWADHNARIDLRRIMLEKGFVTDYEAEIIRRDGTHIWILFSATVFPEPGFYEGSIVDITDRKKAEEALRESEERLEFVLKGSHLGLWDWNIEKNEVRRNERWAEMLGYKLDDIEFTVKQWLDFIHPDDRSIANQSIQDHLEGRTPMHKIEYRMLTKEGQYKWILDQAQVVKHDSHGRPIRMSGTHTDITERKQAEEALRKSEERYRSVVEDQTELICRFTPDCTLTFVNGAYARYWDKTPDKLIGTNFLSLIPESSRQASLEHIASFSPQVPVKIIEHEVLSPNGTILWQQWLDRAFFDEKGSLVEFQSVGRDITDRKRAEEEKRKALEFAAEQSKHALIGQVTGKMAHDFNNVLMGIMGNAQLAVLDCDDEKIKNKLELIINFSERGRDITNSLMSFSKDQEPKQTYFKIEDKIDLVLKMLEKDLAGIQVIRNYKPGIPELLADPGMIQDVLVNLVQNSIHAMSKVENPTLNLKAYSQEDKVYFEIEDNGCGIPKEHQDSVYTPSFTLKGGHDKIGAYNPVIKGTGYGMSNVKKYIVEKHKGDIFLESELGKGTRIKIALRVIKDHLSSDEKKEVVKSQIYERRKILLVEDEPAIADVQYQILTKEPFRHIVSIAVNGQMAIDVFNRNKFDIVSLDYMLPGKINGLDVYKHIRKTDKDIPVMFISGNIEFLESMQALKEKDPNLDHLSKPVDNLSYVNQINEIIGRSIK